MGDWWNDFTSAVGNAANWVGSGVGGAVNAVGQWVSDTQAHAYGYPDAAAYNAAMAADKGYQADTAAVNQNPVSNYLSKNPVAATAFNALGAQGIRSNPTPVGSQDLGGTVDTAAAAYQPPFPAQNQGGFNTAPYIPPSTKLGETPIHVADPQPQPTPSVGLSPVDVTGGYTPTGSQEDEAHYWNPTTNDWQVTPYVAPAIAAAPTVPQPTDPAQPGGDGRLNTALQIAGGAAGVLTNLHNGQIQSDAEKAAADLLASSQDKVLKQNQDQFDAVRNDTKPWRTAGEAALGKLSTFDTDHPMGSFQASPDYAFRLSEGMKALQNSAAGHGSLLGGNALRSITDYGQQAASQEYGNWYNREQNTRNTERNALQSLAGIGQTAVGQNNAAGQNFATAQGNAITGQANALAGGITGAANARASSYQTAAQTGIAGINSAIAMGQANDQYNALLKALQNKSGG